MGLDGLRWVQMGLNNLIWIRMGSDGFVFVQRGLYGHRKVGLDGFRCVQTGSYRLRWWQEKFSICRETMWKVEGKACSNSGGGTSLICTMQSVDNAWAKKMDDRQNTDTEYKKKYFPQDWIFGMYYTPPIIILSSYDCYISNYVTMSLIIKSNYHIIICLWYHHSNFDE